MRYMGYKLRAYKYMQYRDAGYGYGRRDMWHMRCGVWDMGFGVRGMGYRYEIQPMDSRNTGYGTWDREGCGREIWEHGM